MSGRNPKRGAWAAAGFFTLVPSVALAGGLGLAPLLALAALVGFSPERLGAFAKRTWVVLLAFLAFSAWICASALWSPAVPTSQGLRLLGTLLCGFAFVAAMDDGRPSLRLVRSAGIVAVTALAVLVMIEALFDSPISRLAEPEIKDWRLLRNPGRGLSILVVLFWAGLGGWAGGKGLARAHGWVLLAPIGWLAANSYMFANLVSFIAGALAFAFGFFASRIAIGAIFSALAAWLIAAPWVLPPILDLLRAYVPALPESWAVRTSVWRFTAARIAEHPIFGMGLDASRSFGGQEAVTSGVTHGVIPLHPHNAALQIWLETGLVGAAFACLVLLVGGFAATRALATHRWASASACAALAAIAVQWNVSYGAWQEWMIAVAFAAAILVVAAPRHSAGSTPPDRRNRAGNPLDCQAPHAENKMAIQGILLS